MTANVIESERRHEIINHIVTKITDAAQAARDDAAYSGGMDDGGAHNMESKLRYWIDGANFAVTGVTTEYANLVDEYEKEHDPEYQTYLRLKQKYEQ